MKLQSRCVLFDLDGTLVDSAPDLGYAANKVREEQNLPPLSLETYRPHASCGARGLLAVALNITPDDAIYLERKARFLKHYEAHLAVDSQLFDGVPQMLDVLDRAGIEWGIVTNKVQAYTLPLVEALALRRRSACIVSGDSTPNPKPAPDPLLLACEQIKVAARGCVYVGDDLRDIQSGQAAQMKTIAAAWGYLGATPDVSSWAADYIVETPEALTDLFELRRAA